MATLGKVHLVITIAAGLAYAPAFEGRGWAAVPHGIRFAVGGPFGLIDAPAGPWAAGVAYAHGTALLLANAGGTATILAHRDRSAERGGAWPISWQR